MFEREIEVSLAKRNCELALDGWGVNADERRSLLLCGIDVREPGGAAAAETRMRHVVDVSRTVEALVGHPGLVGLWIRLPHDGLAGMSPLDAMTIHASGLRHVRKLLMAECLERGFG